MTKENQDKFSEYEFTGIGFTASEKKKARKVFEDYKNKYHFENLNDLKLLEEKIFREIIQERYKKKIIKLHKSKNKNLAESDIVPKHILEAFTENEKQILVIDEKLGLFSEEKKENLYDYIEGLYKKFTEWRRNNWDSRKVTCPFCSKIFFLNIRTDKYEAKKSPFFENRAIANKPLFEFYKKGKLTKEEVAKVLGVSPDYVDFLEKRFLDTPSN